MNGMNSVLLRRHDASTRTANGRESTRIVVTFASIRGSGPFSLVGQAVPDAEVDWSAEIPNLCPRHSIPQDVIENGVGEWFVVRHSLTYTTGSPSSFQSPRTYELGETGMSKRRDPRRERFWREAITGRT